jgi:hypothetical protein
VPRIFIGSEALRSGVVGNKHVLRTRYWRVHPDVYVDTADALNLAGRTRAAHLWTHREGVVAGLAAAALHGAEWIDDDEPVELIWPNARPPEGIVTRRDRLAADEVTVVRGIAVTTPERTAFDVGRLSEGDLAVERLDALGQATRFSVDGVLALASLHAGSPGVPHLRWALDLHDPGAQSPRETWLRLLLIRGGFPRPRTQIPVCDDFGRAIYWLDMGWDDPKVAVEYDGDDHRSKRRFGRDIVRSEFIAYRGYKHVRVVAGARPADVLNRVRRARLISVESQ